MDIQTLAQTAKKTVQSTQELLEEVRQISQMAHELSQSTTGQALDPFIISITVFALACFVGYYVVWKVTPALHSPLMAVTNAISSVIIIGALVAAGSAVAGVSATFGFFAVVLASVNIFGGFIVTQRMLQMFSKSK
jgi:NAD(P) transhydrogenase subunit alpha